MYGKIPPETLAELLLYLNEHEAFPSIKALGTVSRQDLSQAIQALALALKQEGVAAQESIDVTQLKELKKPFRDMLSSLSSREAKLLLKSFF